MSSPSASSVRVGYCRVAVPATVDTLLDEAKALLVSGYRLALVAAHDDLEGLRAVYLFLAGDPDRRVELHLRLATHQPAVPTLAGVSFPAGRFEREMRDLYGIVPLGHPLPRRLVRHPHWPVGWYPMRRDAGTAPSFGDIAEPFPFLTVEGTGVYEIPVGPVHAGLIEPGHFRFSVVGETILKLKARLWYVHKGLEKLFEGRAVEAGVPLAERVSGDTAVGHALAYCRAVEDALCIPVPVQARRIRAILLEMERLYNHVTDIGALCNDVAHGILNSHALRIRERLLRCNARTTGHRLLRGGVLLGGARVLRLPDPQALREIAADVREVVGLALENSLVAERLIGTAVLSTEQARDLGTLGYVARASGVASDARYEHPDVILDADADADADAVPATPAPFPSGTGGDVQARFRQRAAELDASFALLDVLLADTVAGTFTAAVPRRAGGGPGSGVGIAEGWRGTIVHRVEVVRGAAAEGSVDDAVVTRNKVVDPSFFNWPALPLALANTIVPDFPLANKSFNLSYAGNDL